MVGCFGSHPEDRAMANELHRHLDRQADADIAAELIDQRANDLYRAKLQALPNGLPGKPGYQGRDGYLCWDALDNIDSKHWAAIGRAIRDNNVEEVGALVIKGVTEQLRKEANDEAEE